MSQHSYSPNLYDYYNGIYSCRDTHEPRIEKKYVGFWKQSMNYQPSPFDRLFMNENEGCSDFPIENSSSIDNTELVNKLLKIEELSEKVGYYGCSECRICKCKNGCLEYINGKFVWPEDYSHYLKYHNVAIDEEFKNFIINYDLSYV